MKKLYQKGKVCMADDEQIKLMVDAGWSTKKPVPEKAKASEPEVEEAEVAEEIVEEKPVVKPKAIPKRKVIKKKTDSKE